MHQAQWSPERPLPPPVSLASQRHHEKPPEVTCTSRGNPGFPASTRESPASCARLMALVLQTLIISRFLRSVFPLQLFHKFLIQLYFSSQSPPLPGSPNLLNDLFLIAFIKVHSLPLKVLYVLTKACYLVSMVTE